MTQVAELGLTGSVDHLLFLRVDGDLILAAGRSQGVELIDVTTQRVIRVVGMGLPAEALAALPADNGNDLLLVGGPDGVIREYHPGTGTLRRQRAIGEGAIRDIAVSMHEPANPVVAVALSNGVSLWHTAANSLVDLPAVAQQIDARPFRLCMYSDRGERYLACAYTNGYVAVWGLGRP